MDICSPIFGQKTALGSAGAMQQRAVVNLNGSSNIGALEPMKSAANYQTLRCNELNLRNNLSGLARTLRNHEINRFNMWRS
jgi:hypothetical protein